MHACTPYVCVSRLIANEEEVSVNVAEIEKIENEETPSRKRKQRRNGNEIYCNKMHAGSTSISISRKSSRVIRIISR